MLLFSFVFKQTQVALHVNYSTVLTSSRTFMTYDAMAGPEKSPSTVWRWRCRQKSNRKKERKKRKNMASEKQRRNLFQSMACFTTKLREKYLFIFRHKLFYRPLDITYTEFDTPQHISLNFKTDFFFTHTFLMWFSLVCDLDYGWVIN